MSEPEPFDLPEHHVMAFTVLRDMSAAQFENLAHTLDDAAFPAGAADLTEFVAAAADAPEADVQAVIGTLLSLAGAIYWLEERPEGTIERIVASNQVAETAGARELLAERLRLLLGNRTLRLAGKSEVVARQNERQFVDGHVMTDVRPVFDSPNDDGLHPVGALIVHTLTLQFTHSEGGSGEIFVAMNDKGLQALARTVDRALVKHQRLTEFFAKSHLPTIGTEL